MVRNFGSSSYVEFSHFWSWEGSRKQKSVLVSAVCSESVLCVEGERSHFPFQTSKRPDPIGGFAGRGAAALASECVLAHVALVGSISPPPGL